MTDNIVVQPRALVTGSHGFLGRHFVAELERRGWVVSQYDVAAPGYEARDARDLFRPAPLWDYDLAIHCAAVVNGRQTIDQKPWDQLVDFELDAAAFRWAAAGGCKRLVYFSSSAAYPVEYQTTPGRRLKESDLQLDNPRLPDALYGWSKLTGERLAEVARRAGAKVTVIRPFSGYGADQADCYPFPAILKRVLRGENPVTVWGSGRQVRDFVHVSDVVGATLAAVDAEHDGPLNIGTGVATSMVGLAELACELLRHHAQVRPLGNDLEGVSWRVADVVEMKKLYRPKILLRDGVRRALQEIVL